MKPYRAWRGALELEFQTDAGRIPLSISVELYSRVKKSRSDSFRTLAPSGLPAESRSIDPATGEAYDGGSRKGVKVGGAYVAMTEEALEQINAGTKTRVLKPEAFCPLESIQLDLAIDRFYVRPMADVAGADTSLNIVWNGLLATGLAWCTHMSIRGGHDAVLVMYADSVGLYAALLPFEEEVYPAPDFVFELNEQAGDLFGKMVEQQHDIEPFDHGGWQSEYRPRRQAAIEAVIAGAPVAALPEPAKQDAAVPDLMAALAAAVTKAPAKKPAKTKTKVKA
jgi:non-homologous end joining protein Ku